MRDKPKDIREYLTEQSIIAYREHVIEECATVAEDWGCHKKAVAAIRALKDKP